MSVFTGGPYGRLAVMLNTLSSLNIEIIIIIIIIMLSSTGEGNLFAKIYLFSILLCNMGRDDDSFT